MGGGELQKFVATSSFVPSGLPSVSRAIRIFRLAYPVWHVRELSNGSSLLAVPFTSLEEERTT